MGKPFHPKLGRFKTARVVFHGKFPPGERERLSGMLQAQGGAVADNLNAKVTHLVLPDAASGATMRKKADALRKKGVAVEVMEASAFQAILNPTQDELLAILKDGKGAAKALASVAPPGECDRGGAAAGTPRLSSARFDGMDLSGINLTGLAFEKCTFVGAKLGNTRISEAVECDFSKATGDATVFGKINCSRFTNARFQKAEFYSHLQGSDFTAATLDECTLSESFWASGVTKRPSDAGPCFRRASLCGCLIESAWLDNADFRDADLSGTAFRSCRLDGACFQKAKAHKSLFVTNLLRKVDFSHASLLGANLADADLTDATFAGADLTGANLRGAKVKASALKGVKGVTPKSTAPGGAGPAIAELDTISKQAEKIVIEFRVGDHADRQGGLLSISASSSYSSLRLPDLHDRILLLGGGIFPYEILKAGRAFGHLPVQFDTLSVKSAKASKSGKALRDLVIKAISEAFL